MCWNAKVSLNTFLFSMATIVLAYMNEYPVGILLYVFAFASMQLVEYFLWNVLDNPVLNRFFSKISILLLCIQPIAGILLLSSNKQLHFVYLFLLYLLTTFVVGYLQNKDNPKTLTTVSRNKHLIWTNDITDSKNVFAQVLFWFAFLLYMFITLAPLFFTKYYIMFFFLVTSLLLSLVAYLKDRTWGSMWCWFCNSICVYIVVEILFVRPLTNSKKPFI